MSMFETCAADERHSFNPFRPPDVQQWAAMSLNLDLAWFVLTTHVEDEQHGIGCDHTTLIATEALLLQWLRDTPPAALVALHCMRPRVEGQGRGVWTLQRVREVWLLAKAEQGHDHLLVCQHWSEEVWFEPNRQIEVESTMEGRRLLARFESR
jgi:hypothetical protein